MNNHAGARLNTSRNVLVATAIVAIAGPIIIGVVSPPRLRAQSAAAIASGRQGSGKPGPAFVVSSVAMNTSADARFYPIAMGPDGRFAVKNLTLRDLIRRAYQIFDAGRLEGAPPWLDTDRFDIEAKAEGAPTDEQMWSMVRRLPMDEFKLTVHNETRDVPVYAGLATFAAIEEQLGLRLDSQTGAVDVLVIDRVERPTGK